MWVTSSSWLACANSNMIHRLTISFLSAHIRQLTWIDAGVVDAGLLLRTVVVVNTFNGYAISIRVFSGACRTFTSGFMGDWHTFSVFATSFRMFARIPASVVLAGGGRWAVTVSKAVARFTTTCSHWITDVSFRANASKITICVYTFGGKVTRIV